MCVNVHTHTHIRVGRGGGASVKPYIPNDTIPHTVINPVDNSGQMSYLPGEDSDNILNTVLFHYYYIRVTSLSTSPTQ